MDSSSGYGSWPMQPNGHPELAWQLGQNGMPQTLGSSAMPSSTPASGAPNSTSYPLFLGLENQMMQQSQPQPQAYPQQQLNTSYQPSLYPQAYVSGPAPAAISTSSAYPASSLSVDANTFRAIQAAYPSANPGELINAIFPMPPQQQQQYTMQSTMQHQSPGPSHPPQSSAYMQPLPAYPQQPVHQELFRSQSDHSLANALTFSAPSSLASVLPPPPSSAHSLAQANLSHVPSPASASTVAAPSSSSSAGGEKKSTKLRQSKLAFLPGVAQSTGKKEVSSALPPAPAADAVIVESGSEPGTPPLPPAKALAAKPSVRGSTSNAAASGSANPASAAVQKLSDKVKQPLSRLSVERDPQKGAHRFVEILSDLDAGGRFLRPRPTTAEDRKIIINMLYSIVKLEVGKGYTDSGRKRFFAFLMALPAARRILSAWLKATVPPKKVTDNNPDHSRRYRDTLLPLLSILDYVDMKVAYLKDEEAGIGKVMNGVSARAVDPSARKLAAAILEKWMKAVREDDDRKAGSTPAATAASAAASSAKRKPAEGAAAAESNAKRYKSATAVSVGSTSMRKPLAAAAPSSGSSASARPGLSFFNTGSMKKPASASAASNPSTSSASRNTASHDIMSLVGRLSGGTATGGDMGGRAEAASAEAQPRTTIKKRVRWKEESELVAIKLIEPADYGQDDGEHVEGAGDEHDEGLALRQSVSSMEALMEWREPRQVLVLTMYAGAVGSESVEGPFQMQRKARLDPVVYEDGQEPVCPDETQLDQPGTMAEMPTELVGSETVGIPTPWMEAPVSAADGVDTNEDMLEGDAATEKQASAKTSTGGAASANLSELLAKVGPLIGGVTAGSSAEATAASSAPAPMPMFDVTQLNQLQSIVNAANGSGTNSNAANEAMAQSNVTSAGLSNLLANLARSKGSQNAPVSSEENDRPSYWQQTYRSNQVDSSSQRQESYPGEYQQGYEHNSANSYEPAVSYGQPYLASSRSKWNNSWDAEPSGYGGRGSKRYTVQCKFFQQGNCRSGDRCNFRH